MLHSSALARDAFVARAAACRASLEVRARDDARGGGSGGWTLPRGLRVTLPEVSWIATESPTVPEARSLESTSSAYASPKLCIFTGGSRVSLGVGRVKEMTRSERENSLLELVKFLRDCFLLQ